MSWIRLGKFALVTPSLLMLISCESGGLSYTQVSVAPEIIATFSSSDIKACPTFPAELDTSTLPPAQFAGIGEAAVGHSGPFDVAILGGGRKVDEMHTAIKFDLEDTDIPVEAFNETLVATLVFVYNLTERSEKNSSCRVPISGINVATRVWDASSDFYSALPSRPFTMVACFLTPGAGLIRASGAYSCLVSEAVANWMRDSESNPNYGFVINPPNRTFDACGANTGEPGNRLECVSELSSIGQNIEFVPP